MQQDIEKLYNELIEYIKINGEDKYTFSTKAEIFSAIGEYETAIANYKTALSFEPSNCDLLFGLASSYNNMGDLANASIYFAQCAKELKRQGNEQGYADIVTSFEGMPLECKEIFETILDNEKQTFIFLSICGFGKEKQRYQNLAVALAKMGHRVLYISPEIRIRLQESVSQEDLLRAAFDASKIVEGIVVFTPIFDVINGVGCYRELVKKLVSLYVDATLIVSNVDKYDAVVPFKNKNRIIFDCADDNSDYENAFWSSKEVFKKEQELEKFADDVICSAASLFLRKHIFNKIEHVHLLNNAVSADEMSFNKVLPEPEDLKNIPYPRIMYVGYIYQRFDRELFYQLAKNNPDKSFVVVGGIKDNYVEPIYNNIYILGSKAHSDLAAYYQNSDICIIPYFDTALMSMSCDPVKIHEHIAAGKPTITTYMPDTAMDKLLVYHANTVEGFQEHIDDILTSKPSIAKEELELYLTRNSWISRACHLTRIASKKLYEYEGSERVVERLRTSFQLIKDKHPNFGVIYGIAESKSDRNIAKECIQDALERYGTAFNKRTAKELEDYMSWQNSMNVTNISQKECVGCMACKSICPCEAILINEDELGFLYPKVQEDKCIHCGKCLDVCPIEKAIPIGQMDTVCYGVTAQDELRNISSSGGCFPVFAHKALKEGYYIVGAVMEDDWHVRHIISKDDSDVRKMFESKYSESRLENIYEKTKEKLENGEKILFSGTPCQIAGLHTYLGRDYESLISVSVVCHGVPSPKALEEHISSLSKGKEVIKLSFRDKKKLGWKTGVYLKCSDGSEYVASGVEDPFIEGFLSDIYLRESCYDCKFKSDVFSDIVLGDFWGIERISNLFDKNGVSYVSLNNDKAKKFFQECEKDFAQVTVQKKNQAIRLNPSIEISAVKPSFRKCFLEKCKSMNVQDAYKETFSEQKFDAVLVLWFSCNYGNAITNYALYKALENIGKKVVVIDSFGIRPRMKFKDFAKQYFKLSSELFPSITTKYLLNCSENFIVGSDQVWNYEFSRVVNDNGYFQLSFVPNGKNKMSYGSSFGQRNRACESSKQQYYKQLYQRFDHASSREKFGVEVLQQMFEVKGEYVLDPVFLLTSQDYAELIKEKYVPKRKYILTYILTPTAEKLDYVQKLQQKLGEDVDVVNIIDAEPVLREKNMAFFKSEENVKSDISPEEFLTLFANAEYVVSDSYHGTCFSIIFHKQFMAFVNRESERFETFKEFSLEEHILSSVPEDISNAALDKIDYSKVDGVIDSMRAVSVDFLKRSIR